MVVWVHSCDLPHNNQVAAGCDNLPHPTSKHGGIIQHGRAARCPIVRNAVKAIGHLVIVLSGKTVGHSDMLLGQHIDTKELVLTGRFGDPALGV